MEFVKGLRKRIATRKSSRSKHSLKVRIERTVGIMLVVLMGAAAMMLAARRRPLLRRRLVRTGRPFDVAALHAGGKQPVVTGRIEAARLELHLDPVLDRQCIGSCDCFKGLFMTAITHNFVLHRE